MSFDIRTLAISKTGEMPVRNAQGERQFDSEGNPVTITLHSPGTKTYNDAQHARQVRTSERMMQKMQGRSDAKQTPEDAIEERAAFLTAITISFNNFELDGLAGKTLFSKVYQELDLGHIADDVEKYVGDRANFMRPSAINL